MTLPELHATRHQLLSAPDIDGIRAVNAAAYVGQPRPKWPSRERVAGWNRAMMEVGRLIAVEKLAELEGRLRESNHHQ